MMNFVSWLNETVWLLCLFVGWFGVFFTETASGNNRREKGATRKIKSEPNYLRERT